MIMLSGVSSALGDRKLKDVSNILVTVGAGLVKKVEKDGSPPSALVMARALFVERGTVIFATRDFKPLSFRCAVAFLAALVLMFFMVDVPFCVFAVGEAEAGWAVVAAENQVVDCYGAVSEAEKAGANVTGLLTVLDEAGLLLSKAELASSMNKSDSAVAFAFQSQEKLKGFVEEANVLRYAAMQQRSWDFLVNVAGSIIGTVLVVFGGLVVWFSSKGRDEKAGGVS